MNKLTLQIDDLKVDTFAAQDEESARRMMERSTLSCDMPTECPRTLCATAPCAC